MKYCSQSKLWHGCAGECTRGARPDDDAATESEEENTTGQELTEITDEDVLAALTNLKGKQFNVKTKEMEVADVVQWHKTDTARHTKLVFDDYYQRDQSKGWSEYFAVFE